MKLLRFASLGIKRQVIAIAAATCSAALLLAVFAFIAADWWSFRAQMSRQLQVLADVTGANSAAAVDFVDRHNAQEALDALWTQPHIMCGALYDREGKEFVSVSRPDAVHCVPPRAEQVSLGSNRSSIRVLRDVRQHGEKIGSVYLVSDLRQIEERMIQYVVIALLVLALALGSAVLLSAWLQKFVTAPILELAGVARRVSERRDYSIRAPESASPDLAMLVDGFNNMLERMAEYEAETAQKNEWLERKVNERTNDLQRLNQELLKAKDAAEAASRAKSEFLANMSHEVRTPINGILGMTELALETDLSDEQREYLQMVRNSGDVLLGVINDILDFSKVESGKLEVETIDFQLHDCVEECVRSLAARAHEKGLEIAYFLEPDVPHYVSGDPGRLRQVLGNLVANAIKFTERGEVIVWVRQQAREGARSVLRFSVRDTGIGIPAEKQASLFRPFTQADSSMSRRYGGTGLGLAICVRLLALLHGSIEVHSEEGQGSTFEFALPFDDASPCARNSDPLPLSELAGLPVLIIDDNATNRRILAAMLEACGMVVTAAGSGPDGLQALRAGAAPRERAALAPDAEIGAGSAVPFRLVILDAHMPDMDGFQVAEQIKTLPSYCNAVIMMLTSGGHRGDGARCREIGIAAYLVKPVRRADLMRCIASVLGDESPRRETPELITRHSLQPSRAHLRVLLAEDNLVNQTLVIRLLEKDGHEVILASDGEQAVEAAKRGRFDIIFMDVQMPRMDGFAATAAIRQFEQATGTHTPIIAMTAHALAGYRERCLAGGMDDYVSKPAKLSEIRRVLHRIAGSKLSPNEASARRQSWNPEKALEQTDGDRELLSEIVVMFLTESERHLAEMDAALAAQDGPRLERAAHALKGELGCLAALPAMEQARVLEQAGRSGDFEAAAGFMQSLRAAVAALSRELQESAKVDHEAAAGR